MRIQLKPEKATNTGTEAATEIESWQSKILAIEGLWDNWLLVDLAANIHVYNNKTLMTDYTEQPIKIGRLLLNRVSPGRRKVRLRLGLEDNLKSLILNFQNVYYLPNSLCNLISLGLLNDNGIYYNNKCETLYHVKSKKILTQIQCWKNSYLVKPLNVSYRAIHLVKVNDNDYLCLSHALQSAAEPATTILFLI